jgi:hypothetical protein
MANNVSSGYPGNDDSRSDKSSPANSSNDQNNGPQGVRFDEHAAQRSGSTATRKASVAALLRNPLVGMSESECIEDVDAFVDQRGLDEYRDAFRKGALLARVNQRADGFEYVDSVSEEEKEVLRKEINKRWSQPFMLYFLVVLCAGSAIVQGMDQTAVNGAQVRLFAGWIVSTLTLDQIFYYEEFGITNEWQQGLLNGAPYLCSCLIGCWTNAPLNKMFGRRGTIFISCLISFATGFWMAAADT